MHKLDCRVQAGARRQKAGPMCPNVHTWRLDIKARGGVREGVAPGVEE